MAVESAISGVTVPVPVGAAFAGAVAEALTNVARHAGASQVQLRAGPADGGVSVELADDGTGFDPAGVPAHRRGVRESLVGRMSSVGGAAVVTSVPGSGTRIVLRWPADGVRDGAPRGAGAGSGGGTGGNGGGAEPGPVAGTRAADGTGGGLGDVVATWYGRGFDLAVVWLVGVWHVGNDLVAVASRSSSYRSLTAEVVAWLTMAVVGVVGGVRLLRHRTDGSGALLLAGATLAASALGTAAVPGSAIFSGADWAWGAAGWFGALVLLRRPLAELAALIAANSAVTLAVLAYDGALDRISLARFATVVYGTAALQLTLALTARALDATARRAAAVAEAESAVRRRRQVADELHAGRQDRYRAVRRSVGPLLAGLADGELDAADRRTRNRCAVKASRLRRLFAETDDVPDSLLHELRACTDIADRRGVLVDLQVLGVPSLGAFAFLAKREAREHCVATILAAAADRPYVPPQAAGTMAADERPGRPVLSEQERTALLLWFQSMSKSAVAARMGIAETTVRQYIQRARIKYTNAGRPAATRTQLLARAIQDGLIRADEVTEYSSRATRSP